MSVNVLTNLAVQIRAFRATDDRATCERFLKGHQRILQHHNVSPDSAKFHDWMEDPNCYLIVVESGGEILGGARIETNQRDKKLPVEKAIGRLEPNLGSYLSHFPEHTVGEVCGLWSHRSLALMGLNMLFFSHVCIAMSKSIGLRSLLAFCSQATLPYAKQVGYREVSHLGDQGTFPYPTEKMTATVMQLEDTEGLPFAKTLDREEILQIRKTKKRAVRKIVREKCITFHYDLQI